MKHLIILMTCLLHFQAAFTQVTPNKYVVSLKERKEKTISLQIQGGHSISVEGYDGDDLIVESIDTVGVSGSLLKEAEGLTDLTTLLDRPVKKASMQPGNISELPEKSLINGRLSMTLLWNFPPHQNLLVRVPRSTNFSVYFLATSAGSKLSVKNLTGELNISGSISLIDIKQISGPLTLRSAYLNAPGKVVISDINWKDLQVNRKNRASLYISCAQHDVEVSVPAHLNANVTVGSAHGAFYSDLIPATQDAKTVTNHDFTWALNGGGIPIRINTTYGNIYLRKQK